MQDKDTGRALADLDRDLIEQRIRAIYAAREPDVGIVDRKKHYAEDVILEIVGDPRDYAFCGRHVGIPAMSAAVRALHTELEITGNEILSLIVDGNQAAVRRAIKVRGRGTGKAYEVAVLDIFRFENGLVAKLEQFVDTQAIALAAGRALSH